MQDKEDAPAARINRAKARHVLPGFRVTEAVILVEFPFVRSHIV
jgi:hypothetical protein